LLLIILVIALSNMLGAIVTARIPYLARSLASGNVKLATAPLLAAYDTCPICPSNAADDAIMIITPRSPSGPCGVVFVWDCLAYQIQCSPKVDVEHKVDAFDA
jgi:hypothetical protein